LAIAGLGWISEKWLDCRFAGAGGRIRYDLILYPTQLGMPELTPRQGHCVALPMIVC